MIKIAFKPHETRGEEIIKILEGLGGFNRYNTRKATATFKDTAYCVDERRIIIEMYEEELIESGYKIYTLEEWEKERDEMPLDKAGQITDFEYEGLAYTLPDGYQFVDENGNVINTTKIVLEKKKKEYPKTFEECCEVLRIGIHGHYAVGYKSNTLSIFQNLLICRDAYWKIGLGKPWEPDWEGEGWYVIVNHRGDIVTDIQWYANAILAFPTEEMRDIFYEYFKEIIEQCKELL